MNREWASGSRCVGARSMGHLPPLARKAYIRRNGLGAGAVVDDRSAREMQCRGGSSERERIALHPGVEVGCGKRTARLLLRQAVERVARYSDIRLRPLHAMAPFRHPDASEKFRILQPLVAGRFQIFIDIDLGLLAACPFDSQAGRRQRLDARDLEFHRRFSGVAVTDWPSTGNSLRVRVDLQPYDQCGAMRWWKPRERPGGGAESP